MKPINDLFPETLLVSREGSRIYTTSLKVAEYFHKQHKDVLKRIERLIFDLRMISDGAILRRQIESHSPKSDSQIVFSGLNFEAAEYKNSRGKTYLMYEMSEEGFALLAMGFVGQKALAWKIDFLNAFVAQRAALTQLTARYAHVVDVVRPNLRPTVEGTEAGLSRSQIAAPLGKSAAAITYHRRAARQLGLLGARP